MRILVTGSAGFLGSTLVPLLREQGHYVIGVDREPEFHSDVFYQIDIKDQKLLPRIPFDLCIHLASAVGGFLYNASNQDILLEEEALLDGVTSLCAYACCENILYTSSINVFEAQELCTPGAVKYLDQYTPYAKAKVMSEKTIEKRFKNFTILRPTNLFGSHQLRKSTRIGESHVIPDLLHKISEAQDTLEVLGTGAQRRNFLHVLDAARCIALLIDNRALKWVNIRSEITVSIKELAEILVKISGKNLKLSFKPEFSKFEPKTKLQRFTLAPLVHVGWRPLIESIQEGLRIKSTQNKEYYSHTTPYLV